MTWILLRPETRHVLGVCGASAAAGAWIARHGTDCFFRPTVQER